MFLLYRNKNNIKKGQQDVLEWVGDNYESLLLLRSFI